MTFARRTRWAKRALLSPFCRTRCAGSGIHLTFDDGPHPEHTPAVLDRLAAFGLTATFFLVGKRITDPELVERIRAGGHTLGNHTFAHEPPNWRNLNVIKDMRRCQELVPGATRFRAPLGRLTPGLWLAARRLGLECVGWTLDSGDWRCRTESDARVCAKEVLELARPGDIVLFHDDHRWIGPILDVVLPGLRAAGTI
jgi:peptidoglycan-N-acetylglucosamine deacetylase